MAARFQMEALFLLVWSMLVICFLGFEHTITQNPHSNCSQCLVKFGDTIKFPLQIVGKILFSLVVISLGIAIFEFLPRQEERDFSVYLVQPKSHSESEEEKHDPLKDKDGKDDDATVIAQ